MMRHCEDMGFSLILSHFSYYVYHECSNFKTQQKCANFGWIEGSNNSRRCGHAEIWNISSFSAISASFQLKWLSLEVTFKSEVFNASKCRKIVMILIKMWEISPYHFIPINTCPSSVRWYHLFMTLPYKYGTSGARKWFLGQGHRIRFKFLLMPWITR